MTQHTGNRVDAAVHLWEQMAAQIISIVGEDGFNSLYARSAFLARRTFPWLTGEPLPSPAAQRFAELRKSFEGRAPAQTSAANSLLLVTFTDIVVSLIGEEMTASILDSAWGGETSPAPSPEEESKT